MASPVLKRSRVCTAQKVLDSTSNIFAERDDADAGRSVFAAAAR
jgi:hypothetical protein